VYCRYLEALPEMVGFFIALALFKFGYIDEIKKWLLSLKI
jgi:hypothetical protein